MNIEIGKATSVAILNDDVFFFKLISRNLINTAPNYDSVKLSLRKELSNITGDKYFAFWLNNQIKKAKIKDNRPPNF